MRLGWLCDVHLNFLERRRLLRFLDTLRSREVDAWLLGGDIGEADSVVHYLRALEGAMSGTIYFTLGNHDFYGGSLSGTRERVRRLAEGSERLVWLTATEPRLLEGDVALVGDDGWADARFGDAHGTPVMLNDFFLIEELAGHSRPELVRTLQVLGDQAAARLAPKLEEAAASAGRVLVLTHVPPYREAAWHRNRPSDDDWVPWFACRAALGDVGFLTPAIDGAISVPGRACDRSPRSPPS